MADLGCVWLFGRKVEVLCAHGLAYSCTPALSVMQSAAAAAVCSLCRYKSDWPLPFYLV